ncbi:MAG: type III-B CRISPR module-associated protein Cmr5 [Candidatus Cloacimonas sp. 4484_209]|nr:MAG: type III-B CRISPR module-associated protein Cmr5 [Candidatus Cloacimonas sp. 4484_209]
MEVIMENKHVELARDIGKFAFELVNQLPEKVQSDYRSYVRSLPAMIINNGLGNALAFEFSKGKEGNAHEILLKHIVLFANRYLGFSSSNLTSKALMEELLRMDIHKYMFWTEQILLFLNWLRRFADGMIKEVKGD